jgi:hypothetical protein
MNFSVPGMPFSLKAEPDDSQRHIASSVAGNAVTAPTDLIPGGALAKPAEGARSGFAYCVVAFSDGIPDFTFS